MPDLLIPLIVFLFPLAYSPGPGNLFFAANGARFGLRATIPASLGYHLATLVVSVAVGLGLLAALSAWPGLLQAAKLAGAAYVLRIAWGMLRAGVGTSAMAPRPASFRDGAVLLVLNPKAWLIMALMFSQFLPEGGAAFRSVLTIAAVFTLNNLLAFTLWTAAGDRLAAAFARTDSARALNTVFGGTLAAVALWMALA